MAFLSTALRANFDRLLLLPVFWRELTPRASQSGDNGKDRYRARAGQLLLLLHNFGVRLTPSAVCCRLHKEKQKAPSIASPQHSRKLPLLESTNLHCLVWHDVSRGFPRQVKNTGFESQCEHFSDFFYLALRSSHALSLASGIAFYILLISFFFSYIFFFPFFLYFCLSLFIFCSLGPKHAG